MPDNSSDASESFKVITWNIEGLQRNIYNLDHFLTKARPSLVFLSEPQIFACDVARVMTIFAGKFSYSLNSEDCHDPDLPLDSFRAKGGTMAMWDTSLDPHITVLPTSSPAVLPLLVKLPGLAVACHIGIYLPTAGLEDQFCAALSELDTTITSVLERFGQHTVVFVRGDMNVSEKNNVRKPLLSHIMTKHSFSRVPLLHPSYHHFIGEGVFDSELDVLLFTNTSGVKEVLLEQICKADHPLINSHHDLLISKVYLPSILTPTLDPVPIAPKVPNLRAKILWSDSGIADYETVIGPCLDNLYSRWCNPDSPASMSILLSSTYSMLHTAAVSTNKFVDLNKPRRPKPNRQPHLVKLRKALLSLHKERSILTSSSHPDPHRLADVQEKLTTARSVYKKALRDADQCDQDTRDKLASDWSINPSVVFQAIRKEKAASSTSISTLKVGSKTFSNENVCDGFFESLANLKDPDMSKIEDTPAFMDTNRDYQLVIELAKSGAPIPAIQPYQSVELLYSVRPEVNDLFSITASHFINAGAAGLRHFHLLLSSLISNINNATLTELNDIWAMVLYKGHKKDKESDRSYRTISTCPLLAKCLDLYIGRMYYDDWKLAQAPTQFQGEGSSHDLAALLLTEVVQHRLYRDRGPVFALFLDAKSAFDVVVRQNAMVAAYKAGTKDQGLLYLDSRMSSRRTYPQWGTTINYGSNP